MKGDKTEGGKAPRKKRQKKKEKRRTKGRVRMSSSSGQTV